MDELPQEIIDEIIDNLAFDFATLKCTSLVSKSWTHRSRRRLFIFVPFNSLERLENWASRIPPDPNGIAAYPRAVHLSPGVLKSWIDPPNLERFYAHFRSFTRVERLVISGLETAKFDRVSTPRYFGNFAVTVRSLVLRTASGTPASLFSFICEFPFVENLTIEHINIPLGSGSDYGGAVIAPASVPSFRGELRLLDLHGESCSLVELLCTLPLRFSTIGVSSRDPRGLPQLDNLVRKCGKTLRSLQISRRNEVASSARTRVSLAPCVALQELHIAVRHPKHIVEIMGEILPTLVDTNNLLRIVLNAYENFSEGEGVDTGTWCGLDEVLSAYSEKVSAKNGSRRLALQFRTDEEGAAGARDGWARELANLLDMFPKVGKVEFACTL